MKRIALLLIACAALIAPPCALFAQEATPQPTPSDWMVYDDPAMHFHAPVGFQPIGQRQIPANKLGDDPVIVAGWVYPDRNNPRRLVIQQEFFTGDVHAFQSQYESQLRDEFDTPLFKDKQDTSLRNGMPAVFEEMTSGSGFNVQKFYFLMWADGQRGVAIGLQVQVNDLDGVKARQLLSDVTAVRYPIDRGDL
ncbi:MAG TPA: hypothetical protein VMB20_13950 [Candidatus Acidoferrum sp.]|nr:hypothetical protein [Candidatus Acidoferrum sp.]